MKPNKNRQKKNQMMRKLRMKKHRNKKRLIKKINPQMMRTQLKMKKRSYD